MDFQSSSQSTFRCPVHGKVTEMCFKVEEAARVKGQILNYHPTSGQYGVFLPSDLSMANEKDVKFLD